MYETAKPIPAVPAITFSINCNKRGEGWYREIKINSRHKIVVSKPYVKTKIKRKKQKKTSEIMLQIFIAAFCNCLAIKCNTSYFGQSYLSSKLNW